MTDVWTSGDGMVTLYHGDCLEIMPTLEAGSVDAVVTDLPYGVSECSWDDPLPTRLMWPMVWRVAKENGPFVTTAVEPFASQLIVSALEEFRYDLIWQKDQPTGGLNANKMPLRNHEQILVFYKRLPTYNPQKFSYKSARFKIGQESRITESVKRPTHDVYGKVPPRVPWRETGMRYPLSVVWCSAKERSPDNDHIARKMHPTQKPVPLYAYLVKTYTNHGETVLDFTMGSGTTGVACVQTGRRFIGIEIDEEYFEIAKQRIIEAQMQPRLEGM